MVRLYAEHTACSPAGSAVVTPPDTGSSIPGSSYWRRSPNWNTTKNVLGRTVSVTAPVLDVCFGPGMVKDRWNSVRNGDDNAAYVAEYAGPWSDYMNRGREGGFGALDLAATAGGASAGVGTLRPAFVMEGAYEIGKAGRDAIVANTWRREKSYEDLAGTERTGRELQRELARGRRFGEGASDASNFIRQQPEANVKLHYTAEPEFQVNYDREAGKRIARRAEVSKRPSGWSGSFIDWMDRRYRDWMNAPQVTQKRMNPETGEEEDYNAAAYAYKSEGAGREAAYEVSPIPPTLDQRNQGWRTPIDLEQERVNSTPGKDFMPWYLSMFAPSPTPMEPVQPLFIPQGTPARNPDRVIYQDTYDPRDPLIQYF